MTGHTDLCVCAEMDDENWETTVFEELVERQEEEEENGDGDNKFEDNEVDNDDPEEALPNLKCTKKLV